jgi:hypothetical protein
MGVLKTAMGRICTDVVPAGEVEALKVRIVDAARDGGYRLKGIAISGRGETLEQLYDRVHALDASTIIAVTADHLPPELAKVRRLGEVVILDPPQVLSWITG